MSIDQAINEEDGDPRWGRARTDSAFQSTGSVVGPSASPYFNRHNEIPYSPVVSGAAASTLIPTFGTFGVLVPAAQRLYDNWSPVTGLPGADLSTYSLQAHRDTQIAHGNIILNSYWDQRHENTHPGYAQPSIDDFQAQGLGLQLATGTYGQPQYASYPRTPLPSVAEGVGRTLSNATNRPRPTPRLPPINVAVANGRAASPQSPYSTTASEPETAIYSPTGGGVDFKNPFRGAAGSGLRSPETVASPLDQAALTPQSTTTPHSPFPDTIRTPQSPSRNRRGSRASQERDFNKEEKDFILYFSLQGIRSEAVGLELSRITRQYSSNLGIDIKGKMMGRQVVSCLRSLSESKGTEEEAEQTISDLMARADREGWNNNPGVLSRAKEYSSTLTRGKSIASDQKDRKFDARCRAAHKKWRVNYPSVLPREDAKNKDEKLAFLGMLLEGTAQETDVPSKEDLKKSLVELWESGTIGGEALK